MRVAGLFRGSLACALALFAPAAARAEDAPVASRPAGSDLSRTDVVLATTAPIRPGRNVLWCATSQLAWDALADTVGKGGKLDLGPPAPKDLVAELNRRAFPAGALDAASYLAIGGWGKDGVVGKIRKAVVDKFRDAVPAPRIEAGPNDAVAYAALAKDLPFAFPFDLHPAPISFGGGVRRVRAFGMSGITWNPEVEKMARQVVVWGPEEPGPPVVELLPKGGADRIVLSALDPQSTLEATWQKTADRLKKGARVVLEETKDMTVPRIVVDATRRFDELLGAPLPGVAGSSVRAAEQRVRFALTERGASVLAQMELAMAVGIADPLVFDRPFLLALLRTGASRPYLLLWVGNDDLLDKIDIRPADEKVIAAITGSWVLDRDAMVDAMIASLMKGVPSDGLPDKDDPAKRLTRAQVEAKARAQAEARFDLGIALAVEKDGTGVMTLRGKSLDENGKETPYEQVVRGSFRTDDGVLVFAPATRDGKPAQGWESNPSPIERVGSHLLVGPPSDIERLILKRP
jgi:hypothetical protein